MNFTGSFNETNFSGFNITGSPMTSNGTKESSFVESKKWIIYHCIAAFLWLFTLYLMLSVISFALLSLNTSAFDSATSKRRESATASTGTSSRQNQYFENNQNMRRSSVPCGNKKNKRNICSFDDAIGTLALPAASICTFFYSNIAIVELYWGWRSDYACRIFYHLTIVLYSSAIALVYATLWERQRILYRTKTIKHLANSALRKISLATLFFIAATVISSIVILNLSATAQSTSNGCFRVEKSIPRFVRVGILPLISTAQQVSIHKT